MKFGTAIGMGVAGFCIIKTIDGIVSNVTYDCEFQRDHEDLSISRDLWWELKRSLTMEEMIKVGNVLGSYNRPGLTKGFSEGFSSTIG